MHTFYTLFVGSLPSEFSNVDNLYEDLHWLLLISGYLLADESNGETPLIPKEIISYSSSLKSQVDVQASFQTLCASQNQNQGKCYIWYFCLTVEFIYTMDALGQN